MCFLSMEPSIGIYYLVISYKYVLLFVSFEKSSFDNLHSIKSNVSVNNLVNTILNPL